MHQTKIYRISRHINRVPFRFQTMTKNPEEVNESNFPLNRYKRFHYQYSSPSKYQKKIINRSIKEIPTILASQKMNIVGSDRTIGTTLNISILTLTEN